MTAARHERGAALVITLIFVTAMAAAAVAFLAGRQTDALTLRGQLQAVEAQAMLDSALQQTVVLLANRQPRQTVPSTLTWSFGDVAVRVRFEREAGKIDLNAAADPLLRALPMAFGLDEDRATAFADVVQDWRDDNQLKLRDGAEDRDYRGGKSATSGAADRPFANPAELLYLPGVDRVLWARLQPYVTIYSGTAEPEARSAAGPVRQALEIARGLKPDTPEPGDSAPQSGASGGESKSQGDTAFGPSRDAGRLKGDAAIGGTLSRSEDRAERGRTGGSATDRGVTTPDAAGTEEAAGEGADNAPQTVLLDVRFRNGYEAAAKAVIALASGGAGGPPFVVLDWTPVLGAGGGGS